MNPAKVILVVGALTLPAFPSAAAVVTNDLHLRSGPGLGNPVIAAMPAGTRVNVGRCANNWCRVGWRGRSGYASANYLSGERRRTPRRRWSRASGPATTQEIPRIWGYGFNEPRYRGWPIFGSVIAPDFSTSPAGLTTGLTPADTRSSRYQ